MYGLLAMVSNTVGQEDIVLQKLQIHVQQTFVYSTMNELPIETLATLESAKNILWFGNSWSRLINKTLTLKLSL